MICPWFSDISVVAAVRRMDVDRVKNWFFLPPWTPSSPSFHAPMSLSAVAAACRGKEGSATGRREHGGSLVGRRRGGGREGRGGNLRPFLILRHVHKRWARRSVRLLSLLQGAGMADFDQVLHENVSSMHSFKQQQPTLEEESSPERRRSRGEEEKRRD
uniref:Uncharacterized protein n=1 Tax=Guillardia theta TaxID=55529 RepID=A0A6U6BUS5_GUITH|mmetsp:Transcript_41754/g.131644  ORF Transcript_41754/g.131644 Transcript_41754/m.131644 type:complete len:159 (+) Transcript_41754:713-1189(+)